MGNFDKSTSGQPFKNYSEYMQFIFDCVNGCLDTYISKMKVTFANGEGGYKNVLYPDIELAGDACKNRLTASYSERFSSEKASGSDDSSNDSSASSTDDDEDDFLAGLLRTSLAAAKAIAMMMMTRKSSMTI